MWTCFKFLTNENHFPKTISQWKFDYGLFTNLLTIIVACDFSPSSLKLKRGILPLLTKWYCNFKTTCHINLKFLLWTKLLENLLLTKYLISLAAPLLIFLTIFLPIFFSKISKSITLHKHPISTLKWIPHHFLYFTL